MKSLKTAMNKLRNRRGETMVESLIAVLIASLAMAGLAGMVASSTKMIRDSRTRLEAYYSANNAVAEQKVSAAADEGSFGFKEVFANGTSQAIVLTDEDEARLSVHYYLNDTVATQVVSFGK